MSWTDSFTPTTERPVLRSTDVAARIVRSWPVTLPGVCREYAWCAAGVRSRGRPRPWRGNARTPSSAQRGGAPERAAAVDLAVTVSFTTQRTTWRGGSRTR